MRSQDTSGPLKSSYHVNIILAEVPGFLDFTYPPPPTTQNCQPENYEGILKPNIFEKDGLFKEYVFFDTAIGGKVEKRSEIRKC